MFWISLIKASDNEICQKTLLARKGEAIELIRYRHVLMGGKQRDQLYRRLVSFLQCLLCKSFLLLWWLRLGSLLCFLSLLGLDILFHLLELFFLLFLPFLFQFLLTFFVLIIYFSQFGILS